MYCNSTATDPFLEHIRLICTKIILPLICWPGIICNLLNVIVLTRRSMITSTNLYLLAVSIMDISYLLSMFCVSLQLYSQVRQSRFILLIVVRVFSPLCSFSSNATTWLTVCFTIERLVVVLKPFAIRKWCTINKAKKIIIICLTLTFILTSPEFFIRHINCDLNEHQDVRLCCLTKTKFFEILYHYQYFKVVAVMFVLIPLLVLAIVNTLLIKYIINAKSNRSHMCMSSCQTSTRYNFDPNSISSLQPEHSMSNHRLKTNSTNNDQYKTTYLLVIVVVTFYCLQTPSAINYVIIETRPGKTNAKLIFGNFCNLLLVISAAMNFVLYSFFSQKFRLAFKNTFFKYRRLTIH